MAMQTKLTLKPGQNGTKKWVEKYGKNLLYVRYRYDEKIGKRFKTVEIIVEEGVWLPEENKRKIDRGSTDRLGIRVAGYEMEVREKVKQAGGIWRPRQKLWELPYGQIKALGLEDRIVSEDLTKE